MSKSNVLKAAMKKANCKCGACKYYNSTKYPDGVEDFGECENKKSSNVTVNYYGEGCGYFEMKQMKSVSVTLRYQQLPLFSEVIIC